MNIVHHPRPCIPQSADAITTSVDLAPFGMPARQELLIVEPSPTGNYVVSCLPFFTYGIQFGDLVEIRSPGNEFLRVLKSAGLRTLRFAFRDSNLAGRAHEELHRKFLASRLLHEWHGSGYLAVLLRHTEDQERALQCLGEFAEKEMGEWEIDPEPFA